jgi:kinesin family protein 2/24
MPKPEFVGRCMATPNVTEDHAAVVYSKLWRMHISKQRSEQEYSSAVDAEKSAAPFKDRLRPGMVVRLRRSNMQKETQELALVLSPVLPDGTGFSDQISSQKRVNSYVCANIEPAEFQNAYTLNIWKQKIVHQIDMEAEIILEYDKASRYYFLEL